jgi:hypothetical protein
MSASDAHQSVNRVDCDGHLLGPGQEDEAHNTQDNPDFLDIDINEDVDEERLMEELRTIISSALAADSDGGSGSSGHRVTPGTSRKGSLLPTLYEDEEPSHKDYSSCFVGSAYPVSPTHTSSLASSSSSGRHRKRSSLAAVAEDTDDDCMPRSDEVNMATVSEEQAQEFEWVAVSTYYDERQVTEKKQDTSYLGKLYSQMDRLIVAHRIESRGSENDEGSEEEEANNEDEEGDDSTTVPQWVPVESAGPAKSRPYQGAGTDHNEDIDGASVMSTGNGSLASTLQHRRLTEYSSRARSNKMSMLASTELGINPLAPGRKSIRHMAKISIDRSVLRSGAGGAEVQLREVGHTDQADFQASTVHRRKSTANNNLTLRFSVASRAREQKQTGNVEIMSSSRDSKDVVNHEYYAKYTLRGDSENDDEDINEPTQHAASPATIPAQQQLVTQATASIRKENKMMYSIPSDETLSVPAASAVVSRDENRMRQLEMHSQYDSEESQHNSTASSRTPSRPAHTEKPSRFQAASTIKSRHTIAMPVLELDNHPHLSDVNESNHEVLQMVHLSSPNAGSKLPKAMDTEIKGLKDRNKAVYGANITATVHAVHPVHHHGIRGIGRRRHTDALVGSHSTGTGAHSLHAAAPGLDQIAAWIEEFEIMNRVVPERREEQKDLYEEIIASSKLATIKKLQQADDLVTTAESSPKSSHRKNMSPEICGRKRQPHRPQPPSVADRTSSQAASIRSRVGTPSTGQR